MKRKFITFLSKILIQSLFFSTISLNVKALDKNIDTKGKILSTYNEKNNYNCWKKENNKWHYLNDKGEVAKGWLNLNGTYYYLDPSTGEMQTGMKEINGYKYYLDNSGAMKTGWVNYNGEYYFFGQDGTMKTGWINDGWTDYYLKKDGTIYKGWLDDGLNKYFMDENGQMKKGWVNYNGEYYFFGQDGAMRTGWINDGWADYYLKKDGTIYKGFLNDGLNKYFMDENGQMKTGWISYKGNYYYLNKDGTVKIGWKSIDGNWYHFSSSGEMSKNTNIDYWKISNNGVATYEKSFKNKKLENSSQIILATTNNMNSSYCNISIYEKNYSNEWKIIDDFSGRVGSNGLAYLEDRVQSTNTTPASVMNIIGAFGLKSNPGTKLNYIKVTNNMYWDLNSENKSYNRLINYNPGGDYEHLISYPRQYEYSLITDYNLNQTPNKGGAIFIHCLGRGATGGCVSMPREKMIKLLKWLDPKKNPKILVIPQNDLNNYWY